MYYIFTTEYNNSFFTKLFFLWKLLLCKKFNINMKWKTKNKMKNKKQKQTQSLMGIDDNVTYICTWCLAY